MGFVNFWEVEAETLDELKQQEGAVDVDALLLASGEPTAEGDLVAVIERGENPVFVQFTQKAPQENATKFTITGLGTEEVDTLYFVTREGELIVSNFVREIRQSGEDVAE